MTLDYVASPGNYASATDDIALNISIPSGFSIDTATEEYRSDDGVTGSIGKVVVTISRNELSVLVLESLRSES